MFRKIVEFNKDTANNEKIPSESLEIPFIVPIPKKQNLKINRIKKQNLK